MRWTARLKRLSAYAAVAVLLSASGVFAASGQKHFAAPPPSRPPITADQKARLAELMRKGEMAELKDLVQQLEQESDTSSMPAFGVSKAYLLVRSEKPLQGFAVLGHTLTHLKHLWETARSEENGSTYAMALQLQADLHGLQGQMKERDANRDHSYEVALQALGPRHLQTQWLLYLRMYDAVSAGRYPMALQLSKELQDQLPQPVERCTEDICRSFRFQQANLAGSMGDRPLALKLSKELMPALDKDPTLAAWNVYHLISLSRRLELAAEHRQWCEHAHRMSKRPEFSAQEGIARAIAHCIISPDTDDQRFQALHLQEVRQRGTGSDGQAYLFLQQAENFGFQRRYEEAARAATKAWAIGLARQTLHWQWAGAKVVAEIMSDQQRLPEAIYYAKQAVNAQQQLLRNAKKLEPQQYETLLGQSHSLYEDLSQWLLELQRFSEAEQTLTLAREQSYHRLVRSYSSTQPKLEMTPAEHQLDALTQPLQSTLQSAWHQREHGGQALEQAIAQAAQILLTELPAQTLNQPLPAALGQLEAGQTEVRYLPAPEHLYVVIRRGGHPEQRLRLPVAQKQLTQDIALLRQQLQQPGSTPQAQAHKLYQQLWKPLEKWLPSAEPTALAGQAPEVRVHLEGAMRYLPMAALHDGMHWLGESYALPQDTGVQRSAHSEPVAPSSQKHAAKRQGWSLQGAVHSSPDLPPLPKVRAEIDALAQLATSQGIGHDAYQDAAFTADSLRTALQSRQVVHLASHFKLLPGNAKGSGLYLGNGQLLTLGELSDPGFHFEGLDLLTLSACETAIPSGSSEQGLPVDSLAWLAQARGARNVMASLWAVADEGTQALMQAFYSAMAQGQSHAQALRTAQLGLLASASPVVSSSVRGLSSLPATETMDTLSHPYYWSGFVLLTSAR